MKEKIGLQQLLLLTLSWLGLCNTILKSFVSFDDTNMALSSVTAKKVAHFNRSSEGKA